VVLAIISPYAQELDEELLQLELDELLLQLDELLELEELLHDELLERDELLLELDELEDPTSAILSKIACIVYVSVIPIAIDDSIEVNLP